ncbi:DUF3237 domain-containing protein [Dongia rigui]|uniref:DUF3237 domain-containing protein n=1 Tax=Dongia rigui TaxID=940149 RepID=A0ABU5DVP0_9PROT|nr:DUF3237 domain-containing protein [Dongia rigui]MDY0871344.1 DUF3237 domain-containing protein [Dongia rigui]
MSPALETTWLFDIDVLIGPAQPVGTGPAGERTDYPIIGGSFAGPEIGGVVLAGGADYFLLRPDGVGVLDARYQLRTTSGIVIDIHNRGLWVPNDAGLAKVKAGGEPAADELYCRCTPVFHAPEGPCDWLNRIVCTGRVTYPRADLVRVACFRLL